MIRSKPYSKAYGDNFDAIFRQPGRNECRSEFTPAPCLNPTPAVPVSDAVNDLVNQVRLATKRQQVNELRVKLQELVDPLNETDRMRAFRVFNAAVPVVLE